MMHEPTDHQVAVFTFFGDFMRHAGGDVKRIDTHASVIFLVGERAFKIKRAVRFPYLDYSTLNKRRAACLAELEVNQAFAPKLYRRILPITQNASGQLGLDGEGEPIEWAIEMHRFDENQTLDRLAAQQRIDDDLADKLARAVAEMHTHAPPVEVESWLSAIEKFLNQNASAFHQAPSLFPDEIAAALDLDSHAAFVRLRPLLVARGQRGFVCRNHGDLHLGNIALLDGHPTPFDAIEFDPMVAAGDMFYDLAFLLMDLIERGLKGTANLILNRYLVATRRMNGLDGLEALPFFMSLRAAIRAKVLAAQMQHVDDVARPSLAQTAKVYFNLAIRLLAPPTPVLIAIGGLSGTGKSTLARALAPDLAPDPGAVIVRSDVERKILFGLAETARLTPEAYCPEVNAAVYARLVSQAGQIIAAQHSVIVDAVFVSADERAAIAEIAAKNKVSFRGIFLVADIKTRTARINTRKPDASDADAKIAQQQENYVLNHIDWAQIDASGSLEETLTKCRAALG
jgi:hypothetical protein